MKLAQLYRPVERVVRFQDKLYFKHQQKIRRIRRWIRRGSWIIATIFLGSFVTIGVLDGVEKLANEPAGQWGRLAILIPLAKLITAKITTDTISVWLENYLVAVFSTELAWLVAAGVLITVCVIGCVVILWLLPKSILTNRQKQADLRSEALKIAVHPVPTRRDIVMRFTVVFAIVLVGLHIFQAIARSRGYCPLYIHDTCENAFVTEVVYIAVAIPSAGLSIWNMADARTKQAVARRQFVNFRGSVLRQFWDTMKLVLTATFIVGVFAGFVAIAVMLLGIVE